MGTVADLGLADRPVLVLSPHLDDAWLSAAAVLQSVRCEVWTVFAGIPQPPRRTRWDEASGFADSSETMAARLEEDSRAFAGTGLIVRRLPYLDGAYADRAHRRRDLAAFRTELAEWLATNPTGVVVAPAGAGVHVQRAAWEILRERFRPSTPATDPDESASPPTDSGSPSGLRGRTVGAIRWAMHADYQRRRRKAQRAGMAANPDHLDVRDAVLELCTPGRTVVCFEDLPYLWHARGAREIARLARSRGLTAEAVELPVDVADKFRHVQAYASQLPALDERNRLSRRDEFAPTETYWLVTGGTP
ncbi:hypothetical protein G9U51_12350 [Calidifontibacter sp. DB0510]|uniref:PIG-L family deacetylase n=1 Tax=Metallococcus carri TaxID=1656884 RepID=A0A967B3A0_9MICO|nr:PIG-L family deacetylase [Metallococcus carri]NHN56570.1 hypothetical protein [Metallococcus carri]NOP38869.1 hypothetical protein [Calidifontibacter sp. DB2511S]